MDFDFFKGRRILITGHTGFKGAWLYAWLNMLGASLAGYALKPNTSPSLFTEFWRGEKPENSYEGDITDYSALLSAFNEFKPEIVFHLAAQPLVRLSYSEPVLTYKTNVIGTLNVLEAARACGSVRAFVNITTDKCYENKEVLRGYKEDDPMGGFDMYSSSKGCVEIMSASYRRSFLGNGAYAMATARAGNVIGGGDWAADRLVPDCVRAIESGRQIEIRSPHSVRPWQHVLEPLSGYMLLSEKLFTRGAEFAEGFNFGPSAGDALQVGDVVKMVISRYGKGEMLERKRDALHEANLLSLDISKSKRLLGWEPTYSAECAVMKTVDWYSAFYRGESAKTLTESQISEFQSNIKF